MIISWICESENGEVIYREESEWLEVPVPNRSTHTVHSLPSPHTHGKMESKFSVHVCLLELNCWNKHVCVDINVFSPFYYLPFSPLQSFRLTLFIPEFFLKSSAGEIADRSRICPFF
jgi:hypothetical protein